MFGNNANVIACIFLAVLVMTLGSCAGGKQLRTELAQVTEITDTFTLILHGKNNAYDLETIALLEKEGDGYELKVDAPEYEYKVIRNLPAREALSKAQDFVKWNRSFRRSEIRKIIDDQGSVIGYEVRPLYDPFDYGISNVLVVNYWIKEGGVVKVTIRLHPTAESHLIRTDTSRVLR